MHPSLFSLSSLCYYHFDVSDLFDVLDFETRNCKPFQLVPQYQSLKFGNVNYISSVEVLRMSNMWK